MESKPSAADLELFRILRRIAVGLHGSGVSTEIVDGTLCVFKPQYDKPSATTFAMRSAIASLSSGSVVARFDCVEQTSSDGSVTKFVYRLRDQVNGVIAEWHKDISHGLHTHPIIGAAKGREHVPFPGAESEMIEEILSTIRRHLQV